MTKKLNHVLPARARSPLGSKTYTTPYLQRLIITLLMVQHFNNWHTMPLMLRINTLKNYTMKNDYTATLFVLKGTNNNSRDVLSTYLADILLKWVTKTQLENLDSLAKTRLSSKKTRYPFPCLCFSLPLFFFSIFINTPSLLYPRCCCKIPWFYTLPARTKTHKKCYPYPIFQYKIHATVNFLPLYSFS